MYGSLRRAGLLALLLMVVAACGTADSTTGVASGETPRAVGASDEQLGTVVEGGGSVGTTVGRVYESFSDVADHAPVIMRATATDNAWEELSPGMPPKAQEWWKEQMDDGESGPVPTYEWREYEVEEVLQGSYSHPTVNVGRWLDGTEAGNTYVLFIGILTIDDQGTLHGTDSDFSSAAPAYQVLEQEGVEVMISTDPERHRELPARILYADFAAQIGAE